MYPSYFNFVTGTKIETITKGNTLKISIITAYSYISFSLSVNTPLSAKDHVMFSAEKERLIRQLDSEFEKINLNEEQKEYYTNMLFDTIENSVTSYGCDEKIGEIITEEAEAFFKDLSTLDETVERMTKRINLYFAEKH